MYVTTDLPSGGQVTEWVLPPPAPTHKTRGLSRTEYRSLFTIAEQNKLDKARSLIEGNLAWLPLFTEAHRDTLRTIFMAYHDTYAENGFNLDSATLIAGINFLNSLGFFDNDTRKNTILLGLPIK